LLCIARPTLWSPSRVGTRLLCSVLCFAEVAALFKQLSPEQSSQSAANAAVEALLLVDGDTNQQLDRAEFGKLLAK
jgi:hypothetical protein